MLAPWAPDTVMIVVDSIFLVFLLTRGEGSWDV